MQTEQLRGHLVAGGFATPAHARRARQELITHGHRADRLLVLASRDGRLEPPKQDPRADAVVETLGLTTKHAWLVVARAQRPRRVRTHLRELGADDVSMCLDPIEAATEESFPASDAPSWTPGRG